MVTKIRRTLHQVFCDEGVMPGEHQFVWHGGVILRKVNFTRETDENILFEEIVTGDFGQISFDCDILAECCREVFSEELKTLEVLYGE